MSEICFSATKKTQGISLEVLRKKFYLVGLPCTVEQDSPDTYWLVFEPHEATIYASTRAGKVVLATLSLGPDDEPAVMQTITDLMESLGFSVDEDVDYA